MKLNKYFPFVLMTVIIFTVIPFSKETLSETFTVGLKSDWYPPFYFEEGNANTGIYIDILHEIGRITGDDFKKEYYHTPGKYEMFKKNLVDIEPGVNPAWRKKYKDISVYTVPFGRATDVMLFRKGARFPVKSILDLEGKSVGAVRGYVYPGFITYFDYGRSKRDDSTNEEQLLRKLVKERTDLAFINKTVAQYLINLHHYDCEYGNVIGDVEIMFRLHINKKDALDRFNQALKKLLENGTIDKIYAKYR